MANANANSINIFDTIEELTRHAGKTRSTAQWYPDHNHYRILYGKHKGYRYATEGHGHITEDENQYRDAVKEISDNNARYIKLYNERYNMPPEAELKHISLWRDYNHNGLRSYHGVDTSTKYCPLHMKNEKPYLYMGIELEVTWDDEIVDGYSGDRYDEYGDYDDYGEYDEEGEYIPDKYDFDIYDIVSKALEIGKGLFTAEEDGSLYQGYSAEFVSRPLSPQAWHSKEVTTILKEFTDYLKSTGAMVEQPEGNGFHIHVSKKFFEANPACNRAQSEVARDMNWIFQKYQDEIEVIGGRKYNDWCASAKMGIMRGLASNYGIVIEKAHIEKKETCLPYGDHHKAFIDSTSGNTYEARVFHSTLDPERILACIEFMRNISHGARENALEGKTFGQITRYKDAPNLQAIIKRIRAEKKKLYLGKKNTNRLAVSFAD